MRYLRSAKTGELCKLSYDIYPYDNTSIHERIPRIKIIIDNNYIEKVEVILDGMMLLCTEHNVNYIRVRPKTMLDYGRHNINLNLFSNNEKLHSIESCFYIEKPEEKYTTYYGSVHSHTSYSDGRGTPTEAYEHAMKNNLDFWFVSDHVNRLIKNNINHDKTIEVICNDICKWEMMKLEAERINANNDKFLALAAYELSTSFAGHINVFNNQDIPNKRKFEPLDMYEFIFDVIKNDLNIVMSINHPFRQSATMSYSATLNKVINLLELGNGSPPKKYIRSEKQYYEYLDKGWILGAVNGQDNHIENWGEAANVTGIMATDLSREALINAMRKRRVFSSESRSFKIVYKVNGYIMGNIINLSPLNSIYINFTMEDSKKPIKLVEVVVNGGKTLKMFMEESKEKIERMIIIPYDIQITWCLIKVTHVDNSMSFSSPVFFKHHK